MSRVWLITGSSRGLGRHLAKAVLAAGHRLVAIARRPDDLYDLVAGYRERVRADSKPRRMRRREMEGAEPVDGLRCSGRLFRDARRSLADPEVNPRR